ncbi:unnamed protein product [Clonostachys solani]|uniref:C2H2-type domain-containing protein n=1 Tax=Clonostachys solani TaxID=160281 RepID=A0A9N9Z8Y3_9HYPO|nr:unnamed protein product [Clonostachys solani]
MRPSISYTSYLTSSRDADVEDDFSLASQEGCSQPSSKQSRVISEDSRISPSLASIAAEDWTRESAYFEPVAEASDSCSGGLPTERSSARSSDQAGTTQNEPGNPDGCIKSWTCNTRSSVLADSIDMAESRASDSEDDSIDVYSDSFAWTDYSEPTPEWDPYGEVLAPLKREYVESLLSSFQLLQRQCPADTASDERDSGSSNGSANGKRRDTSSPSSTDTGSRPAKRRNINSTEDNSDEDEGDNHQQKVPSTTTEKDLVNGLIFACPFVKRSPDRYRQCYSHNLLTISRVKFHLRRGRYHHLPLYCPTCSETFEEEKLRDEHIRAANCPKNPPRSWDGITQSQSNQLSKRTPSKKTAEENWYDIYKIIFPGEPLPSSPYIDVSLSGELSAFREHELSQGPFIWRKILQTRLPSHLHQHLEELQSFYTSFYPEAISVLYQGWASRKQQTISLPPQPSTQQTSIPAGSNDILAGGVLDSPPRSDSAIGNSVSGSSENERRPEKQQLEQPRPEQQQLTAQAGSQLMLQPSSVYQTMPPYPTLAQIPPQMLQSQAFSSPMGQASLADTSQQPFQTPQMGQLVTFTDSDDLLHPMFTGAGDSMGPTGSVVLQYHY